ncbi:DUF302 domain-containing protein [Mesorhizobium sp. M0243]|uniref:DUF302 domain-containing protein n=2 Tax=Mesorhizobium TaxID=68287 RepID=UPI0003D004F7|nr:hypothetical protein X734_15985 [Mesorhizobium sp. L2C084A000]
MTDLVTLDPSSMATIPRHQIVVSSSYGFDETLQRLRDAIAAAELWIIHEIDPQALLRKGGISTIRLRQLLWFHPRYMARLLLTDPGAVPEAPFKFVVSEQAAGVTVCALNPILVFSPYPRLFGLAHELFDATERMLETVSTMPVSGGDI